MQVNALRCSSAHYLQQAGIGYLEIELKVQRVFFCLRSHNARFQCEFDKYKKNASGSVFESHSIKSINH